MNDRPAATDLRVRLDLAYVGTAFHGWQMQPGQRTVQGELAARLARLLGRQCRPVGAGRTDAGVHARGQVAHVQLHTEAEGWRVCRALPKLCPDDIQVLAARRVSPAFNARLSATRRRYSYRLQWQRNLFEPFALSVPWPLDQSAMDAACRRVRGVHDFSSFCKAGSLQADNHCRIDLCAFDWEPAGGILHIRADRFLHHMVRNLMGVLLEIGRGRRRSEDLDWILAARDRRRAGPTAPAHALFLEEVTYPPALLDPDFTPPDATPRPPAAEGDDA